MAGFLQIGVLLAMAAVAGVLIMGIVSMARGKDARKQNKLMQLRVVLQGLALLLLFILSLMAVGS
ncbi:twin transmembrane helix small protein [Thalassospira sp.]|uniref:twin transmembrane helix small protein n=1 Tax=Thalassospira sp. TaxID=1912094 RepID=UPI003AA89014